VVQGLYPLWERTPDRPVVTGMGVKRREVLLTSVLDARPDSLYEHPSHTIYPLLAALALGVTFITAIFTPWGFVVGSALLFPALLAWMWPESIPAEERTEAEERI
jgi:cytochrome c oxidase subunit I+III